MIKIEDGEGVVFNGTEEEIFAEMGILLLSYMQFLEVKRNFSPMEAIAMLTLLVTGAVNTEVEGDE